MCLTPLASIVTASTEFGIAAIIAKKITDKRLYPFLFFVVFLGAYQFTEFMLCKSEMQIIWARIGFAVYTFLPALGSHGFVNIAKKKFPYWTYLLPIFFSIIALFFPGFISQASCNFLHTTVKSLIFDGSYVLMILYIIYYTSLPLYGVYLFSKSINYSKIKTGIRFSILLVNLPILFAMLYYFFLTLKNGATLNIWLYTGLIIFFLLLVLVLLFFMISKKFFEYFYLVNVFILSTVSFVALALYLILPDLTYNFSSIFCQFAILYGVSTALLIFSLRGELPK